jgi:hypothetical protein
MNGAMSGTMVGVFNGRVVYNSASGRPNLTQVLHNPVAGMGSQHPGRGYAITDTAYLPPGPVFTMFTTNFPCTGMITIGTMVIPLAAPPGCGIITAQGAAAMTTTGPGTMNLSGPADTNTNHGFPWTTGTVTAQNIELNFGNPASTTITAMGQDDRTPMGAGTITMVAGGLSHRVVSNQHFAAIDGVTMTFGNKTPSISPTGFAVAAVLMVLAVGYAFRRRL